MWDVSIARMIGERSIILESFLCLVFFMHMPTVPVAGVGKEGRPLIDPWGYLNRKLPVVELP